MAEEPLPLRERPFATGADQVVDPEVVPGDVRLGGRVRFGTLGERGSRGPRREAPGEPCLCPPRAGPARTLGHHLVERVQPPVQEHGEGDLRGEAVVLEMGARIGGGEQRVHRELRAALEVRAFAPRPGNLQEVAVGRLEGLGEPEPCPVEDRRVGDECRGDELLQRRRGRHPRPARRPGPGGRPGRPEVGRPRHGARRGRSPARSKEQGPALLHRRECGTIGTSGALTRAGARALASGGDP